MKNDASDPSYPIRLKAASYEGVMTGTSCNQSSFKLKQGSFLFIGPGKKGVGYKAMFKLDASRDEALDLSKTNPDQFEVGSSIWVTTRFTEEAPLSETIWKKWLDESYSLTTKPKR